MESCATKHLQDVLKIFWWFGGHKQSDKKPLLTGLKVNFALNNADLWERTKPILEYFWQLIFSGASTYNALKQQEWVLADFLVFYAD
jgi:cellobiose-specific phosphotransferase system component IIC